MKLLKTTLLIAGAAGTYGYFTLSNKLNQIAAGISGFKNLGFSQVGVSFQPVIELTNPFPIPVSLIITSVAVTKNGIELAKGQPVDSGLITLAPGVNNYSQLAFTTNIADTLRQIQGDEITLNLKGKSNTIIAVPFNTSIALSKQAILQKAFSL